MTQLLVPARHHTRRTPGTLTHGPAVDVIARAKRRPLMPWQQRAADCALEIDPRTGLYRYGIVVVTVPRQAGKTKFESDVADHRCLSLPDARVWITMQNGKTVDSWMREEHHSALTRAPAFRGQWKPSLRAGEVGVRWPALGSTFYTFPPKRDALHSKQLDLGFVDEAWAHGAQTGNDLRQALQPMTNTRPGAQLWIVSTMGDDSSVYLDGYIERGKASLGDPNTRVCFIDYGVPLDVDVDPDDLDAIAARHPAYGFTIGMQALVDAREEFRNAKDTAGNTYDDVNGWLRAYGNRPTATRDSAFAAGLWTATARPRVPIPERAAIALDATPSGDWFALGAGWKDDAGEGYLEVVDNGAPTRGAPAMIVEVCRRRDSPLYVDRASMGALELVDAVAAEAQDKRVSLEVRYLTTAEYGSACGIVKRGVEQQTVHHFNDRDLDANVDVLATRPLGDGGIGWARKGSAGRITEMVSTTVALKGFDLLPPPRRRPVAYAGRAA